MSNQCQLKDGVFTSQDWHLMRQFAKYNLIKPKARMTKEDALNTTWLAIEKGNDGAATKAGWINPVLNQWRFAKWTDITSHAKSVITTSLKQQGIDYLDFLKNATPDVYHINTIKDQYPLSESGSDSDSESGSSGSKDSSSSVQLSTTSAKRRPKPEPKMTVVWDFRFQLEGVTDYFEQVVRGGQYRRSDLEHPFKVDGVCLFVFQSARLQTSKIVCLNLRWCAFSEKS